MRRVNHAAASSASPVAIMAGVFDAGSGSGTSATMVSNGFSEVASAESKRETAHDTTSNPPRC